MIWFTFLVASLTSVAALAGEQSAPVDANYLPPIDIAAPSDFETISFGLG